MTKSKPQIPLYEQVVKTIQDQIVSGAYRKGDILPSEKDLIESMGVSRITVRKALAILAETGIIETSKGRGSVVIFDVEDMAANDAFEKELYEYRRVFEESTQVRLMLEPEVARQVALAVTDEQIEYLQKCVKADNEEERHDLHRAIVSVLQNKELNEIMNQLIEVEESKAPAGAIPPAKQEKTIKIIESQHRRIVDAITARDAEFAYFYMKEHTKYIKEMYEEYFERMNRR